MSALQSNEKILSVAFGNGMFVAVASYHVIASTNGTDWAVVQADTSLQRITYGNGTFVAVGASAGISTSTDGYTWRSSNLTYTYQSFLSVAYGNGVFVAVGGGMVATSPDGVTWTMMPDEYAVAGTLVDVCYGNGKFVIIGQLGDNQAITFDGTTWSHITINHPIPNTIAFLNGQFVLSSGDQVYGLAEDGTLTKSPYLTLGGVSRMIFADGRYLGVGSGGAIIASDDGVNWNTRFSNFVGSSLNAVKKAAFGNDVFVAISNGTGLFSTDGANWKGVPLGATGPAEGLTFDGSRFYVLDILGNILSSTDGTGWAKIAETGILNLRALGYGANTLVAVGDGGKIVTSSDGNLWFSRQSGVASNLTGIVYGNGTFIAYSYGTQVTSADGTTWTKTGTNNFYSITFGNGQFLATDGGRAYTSNDGKTWVIAASSFLNQYIYGLAYSNGLYFAASYTKDIILTSEDGIDWASVYSDTTNTGVCDVVFGKGTFVAVGGAGILQTPAIHSITAAPAVNGVLSCDASVSDGQDGQCSVSATGDYILASLIDNGVDVTSLVAAGKYTIHNVIGDHTVAATFGAPPPVNGVCGSANGAIVTTKPVSNLCSAGTASAVSDTTPWKWSCAGNYGGSAASCSANIRTYTVTATVVGANGTVTCSSPVSHGSSATCKVTPATGWQLATFYDNSVDKKCAVVSGIYTIGNVTANHAIGATFSDATKPTVTTFTIPATSTSATVPLTITATDNKAVTAYYLSTSSTAPVATATGWVATKPLSYTFTGLLNGIAAPRTLYLFAKDAAGNVSLAKSAATTITLPDTTKPVITALTIPATGISAIVPLSITATDNAAVTGYFLSTTATAPTATATGWSGVKPISFTFTGLTVGVPTARTVYAFVKDAANNISPAKSATTVITLSKDITKPTITAFAIPATSVSATIPITMLTASDNVAITGYFVSTSSTAPNPYATGWVAAKPSSYTFTGLPEGVANVKNLFVFAKDAAGNVSFTKGAATTITLPDTTKPVITALAIPATSTTAIVPVSLSASDNVGVTGYFLSTTAAAPTASAAGWSSAKPVSYTFNGLLQGVAAVKTLYVFAKDAARNVSLAKSAATTITLPDTTKPLITAFTIPATSSSATVPVSLTASDNMGITGYFLSTTATAPTASAAGWSSAKPISYTFTGIVPSVTTTKALYLFVKDQANNISVSGTATTIYLRGDVTKPVITAFTLAASSDSGSVPITGLTATDDMAVTGYYLSTSAAVPNPYAPGWSSTRPTSYVFTGLPAGVISARTVYLFVKDEADNISAPMAATTTIVPVSQLFSTSASSSTMIFNGYLQAGSSFTFTIRNTSTYTFQLMKAELTDGGVVLGSSTDSSILNGGQLAPGQSASVVFTLRSAFHDNGFRFTYYLNHSSSSTAFRVYNDYNFSTSLPF